MSKIKKIYLCKEFVSGLENCELFMDFQIMTHPDNEMHLNSLLDFIKNVKKENLMKGKNVFNTGKVYNSYLARHYHSGIYCFKLKTVKYNNTPKKITKIYKENKKGATSGAVVHYCWRDNSFEEMIILGYSPIRHQPFPNKNNNPLRKRMKKNYLEDDLYTV